MLWMILVLGALNAGVGLMLFLLIVTIRRQTSKMRELRRQFDETLKQAGDMGTTDTGSSASALPGK